MAGVRWEIGARVKGGHIGRGASLTAVSPLFLHRTEVPIVARTTHIVLIATTKTAARPGGKGQGHTDICLHACTLYVCTVSVFSFIHRRPSNVANARRRANQPSQNASLTFKGPLG